MSDINTRRFTTRNSVWLMTFHRARNLEDESRANSPASRKVRLVEPRIRVTLDVHGGGWRGI